MSIFGYISDGSGNTTSPYNQSNVESGEPLVEQESFREPRKALKSSTERMRDAVRSPLNYRCKSSRASLADPSEANNQSYEHGKDFWAPLHDGNQNYKFEDGPMPGHDSDVLIESDRSKIRHLEASLKAAREANLALRLEKSTMMREYEQIINKLLNLKSSLQHSKSPTERCTKKIVQSIEQFTQTDFKDLHFDLVKPDTHLNSSCGGNCNLHCQSPNASHRTQAPSVVLQTKEITLPYFESTRANNVQATPAREKTADGMLTPVTSSSTQTPTVSKPTELSETIKHIFNQPQNELEDTSKWSMSMLPSLVSHRQTAHQSDSQNQTVVSTTVKRIKVDGQVVYEKSIN